MSPALGDPVVLLDPAPAGAPPRYSIVIVCHGKRAVTEGCLRSLDEVYGSRIGADVELLLVDNASPDDTPELLRSWSDRATVILSPRNLNYAGGNNAGVRAATAEVVILLNNDTELLDEALDELAEEALAPGVGVAGCRLLYPDGTIQHGGCAWRRDPHGRVLPFHLFQYEAGDLPAARATYDGDAVTGACLAIRRTLYRDLGGLDEVYVNGLEDIDLCLRARLAGHRVSYRGDLAVIHHEGATRSRRPDDARNQSVFLSRYGAMAEPDTVRFAEQFDAAEPPSFMVAYGGDAPFGTLVSMEGEVCGLAPECGEARALLTSLEGAGLAPAMREWQPRFLQPRFDSAEERLLDIARRRPRRRDALIIQTPLGRLGAIEIHPNTVLRVAVAPSVTPVGVAGIWVPNPNVADEFVAAGADPDRVHVLAPPVADIPVGQGRRGLLVILPGHDLDNCRTLLEATAAAAGDVPVRLAPTVSTERLADLARELVPAAEMLTAVCDERRLASLAGEADVVVAVDSSDRFDRRALVAAAAGATVVHPPGGTAAWVLGDELRYDGDPMALHLALTRHRPRRAQAERVCHACGPQVSAPALARLVERARGSFRPGRRASRAPSRPPSAIR